MEPEVLLFDEPTSALDPQMVDEVFSVILNLAKSGLAMIIVTHEMQLAYDVADYVYFMYDGVIIEDNRPHELFKNPQHHLTKNFLKMFNQ